MLILDTHTIIWYLQGSSQLPDRVIARLEDVGQELSVSAASYWEMAIKMSMGKLTLPNPLEDFIDLAKSKGIETLAISEAAIAAVRYLPLHHRDPFDRVIIAQAKGLSGTIVTRDPRFGEYEVEVFW
jgi:PIN domain nuclease of toxin-antitoxin system